MVKKLDKKKQVKVNLMQSKMFVIRKYVMAKSAKDAIRKDKTLPVDDVWIDSDWQKRQTEQLASAVGFYQPNEEYYD